MTWRRAWGYMMLFIALTLLQFFTGREAGPPYVGEEVPPADAATPLPFLAAEPEDIAEVEIEMSGQYAQIKRAGIRWEVVQPAGREVSGDLMSALLTAVLLVPEVEVVGLDDDRTGDFGLEAPTAVLRLRPAVGPLLTIRLGTLNPARTAVYASGSGTRQVVLLGLNVQYYLDLLTEALWRNP